MKNGCQSSAPYQKMDDKRHQPINIPSQQNQQNSNKAKAQVSDLAKKAKKILLYQLRTETFKNLRLIFRNKKHFTRLNQEGQSEEQSRKQSIVKLAYTVMGVMNAASTGVCQQSCRLSFKPLL